MWDRFQMGSNRPLAKRKARMFWAASLPRKWSMRKICSSAKTSCSDAFSALALARSMPNGFSMMIAGPVDQVGLAQHAHHLERGLGRDAQVVQAPAHVAQLVLGLAHRRGQAGGAVALADEAELGRELVPLVVARRVRRANSRTPPGPSAGSRRRRGRRARCPMIRHSGTRPASDRWSRPGQQLALGQVAAGPEQHDHVRVQRRHQRRADVGGLHLGAHAGRTLGKIGCRRVSER